jgi:dipeptidyl aminopeptidase/acylaminoacyl peptidase
MNRYFNNKRSLLAIILIFIVFILMAYSLISKNQVDQAMEIIKNPVSQPLNPLSIQAMREKRYPGSNLIIESTLADGKNYHQYIASYKSDGLKIYGLLTVPANNRPINGYPAIIFNHGYIPPDQYRTTERYVAYVDYFAIAGYIVFKPDFRGHGSSEGNPEGAYYSPAYTTDALNALSSIKLYKDVNPEKIGMWGHSMGGNITLRSLVINSKDIKAAVIWGGVVGTYDDLLNNWQRKVPFQPSAREMAVRISGRRSLVDKFGTPKDNPSFWNSIDPTYFVSDINAPVQLDAGEEDEEVPAAFSQQLYDKLKKAGKNVQLYIYPGDDHNISQGFSLAMQRSLKLFDEHLK